MSQNRTNIILANSSQKKLDSDDPRKTSDPGAHLKFKMAAAQIRNTFDSACRLDSEDVEIVSIMFSGYVISMVILQALSNPSEG